MQEQAELVGYEAVAAQAIRFDVELYLGPLSSSLLLLAGRRIRRDLWAHHFWW